MSRTTIQRYRDKPDKIGGKMSQIRASENVEAFQLWSASMTVDDFKQIVWRGQLKRSEVAKGCGFSKSALIQNPTIKQMLEELEESLRGNGALPQKTPEKEEADSDSKPKQYDSEASARNVDKNRLRKLEQENLELKAKLRRYEELSEVLTEMGIKF